LNENVLGIDVVCNGNDIDAMEDDGLVESPECLYHIKNRLAREASAKVQRSRFLPFIGLSMEMATLTPEAATQDVGSDVSGHLDTIQMLKKLPLGAVRIELPVPPEQSDIDVVALERELPCHFGCSAHHMQ